MKGHSDTIYHVPYIYHVQKLVKVVNLVPDEPFCKKSCSELLMNIIIPLIYVMFSLYGKAFGEGMQWWSDWWGVFSN